MKNLVSSNLEIAEESILSLIDSYFSHKFHDTDEYQEIKEEFQRVLRGVLIILLQEKNK
jgi:hypothetical protein